MSAGSIVRPAAWEATGGYDKGLFVDYVDFDFSFGWRQYGRAVV
jgi:GT2 family glycosyltransferase